MPSEEAVIEQLKACFDPEIPVNIYDLGLVYRVGIDGGRIDIQMTFTSESCPSARAIPEDIKRRLEGVSGVDEVNFHIVWEPAWHPRMISAHGKKELGMDEDNL